MVDEEIVYENEDDNIIITKTLAKFDEASYPITSIGSVFIEERRQ